MNGDRTSVFKSQTSVSVGSYGIVYESGGVLSFNQGCLRGYECKSSSFRKQVNKTFTQQSHP